MVADVDERDPAYDYDGGWEEGIDGGEGFTEHLLGPVDPYDRKDHYTPHPRFATRPEMRWLKAEDPIENLPAGQANAAPGRGPQKQRRPTRGSKVPKGGGMSNPVVTPAEAERLKRALGHTVNSKQRAPEQPEATRAYHPRRETRGERLARQKGYSDVKGITRRQANELPDLRRPSGQRTPTGQATPGHDQLKKPRRGQPKQRAPKPGASTSRDPVESRRRANERRRARATIERSMQRAREERETTDRLLAGLARRAGTSTPVSRPLRAGAAPVPSGVCRSCSRPISATGQCACS
jgi:hypothetical protein